MKAEILLVNGFLNHEDMSTIFLAVRLLSGYMEKGDKILSHRMQELATVLEVQKIEGAPVPDDNAYMLKVISFKSENYLISEFYGDKLIIGSLTD